MTDHQAPNSSGDRTGGGTLGAAASLIAIMILIASALWALNVWPFSGNTSEVPVDVNEESRETTATSNSPFGGRIS